MLKDDRMMSMLTFVVIMLAVGAMTQRADIFSRYFGGSSNELVLQRDDVIIRANTLSGIDVLANDLGLRDGDATNLIIIEQPMCGNVYVQDGQAEYLPLERCTGTQTFRYGLFGRNNGQAAEVVVTIRLSDPTQSGIHANAQRDITLPAPAGLRASAPRVTAMPSILASEAAAAPTIAAILPSAVPKPLTPLIAVLLDTPSTAGAAGGPMVAGVTLDGFGLAPKMAAPEAGLAEATMIATAPVILRPDREPYLEIFDPADPTIQASWAPMITAPPQAKPTGQAPTTSPLDVTAR
jgi:hypothetical protein